MKKEHMVIGAALAALAWWWWKGREAKRPRQVTATEMLAEQDLAFSSDVDQFATAPFHSGGMNVDEYMLATEGAGAWDD